MKTISNIKKIFIKSINLIRQVDGRYIYITLAAIIISSIIPVISLKIMQQIINIIQIKIDDGSSSLKLIILYLRVDLVLVLIHYFY